VTRRSGFTLLEMLIVCSMVGLLITVLFAIFFQGASAWRLSDARSDLEGEAALILHRLTLEAQQSSRASLSTAGEAVSFASARDAGGDFQNTPQGDPLWQEVVVYYRHPEGTLRRRELPLPTPQATPLPIQDLDLGWGPRPLADYLSEGKVAARLVESFQPVQTSTGMLQIAVRLRQTVGGNANKTTTRQLATTILIRNP
jgi:prepilin-type N-terminal cleavage/methylation domain-containing protein